MPPNQGTTGGGGAQAKLPSTSDFNQVFNRINLSLAKHSSFLQNIRARHPPPPQTAPSAKPAPSTTGAGFSSLAGRSSSSASARTASQPSNIHRKSRADLDAEEAQFAEHSADVAAAALGSNAGIGYVPERKATERAAEDRDLRGRLLGKRAREQREEAAAAKNKKRQRGRGGAESSDDDEEVGRSGLGWSKKKKAAAPPATMSESEPIQQDIDLMDQPQLRGSPAVRDGTGSELEVAAIAVVDRLEAGHPSDARGSPVADEPSHHSGQGSKKKRKRNKKAKRKGTSSEQSTRGSSA